MGLIRIPAWLTDIILLLFTAINTGAMAVGTRQAGNPLLAGFYQDCVRQPCWHGIVPGVTEAGEAQTILAANGYSVVVIPRGNTGEMRATPKAGNCRINLQIDYSRKPDSLIYGLALRRDTIRRYAGRIRRASDVRRLHKSVVHAHDFLR